MRFLASLLVAGLVSAGSAFSAVDAGLLALVPPDAQLVSGVHVSQSRVSPFGQFVISQFQTEPGDLQDLVNQTGFDPGKDVSEVLMAFNGKPKEGNGLVLARGNFDPERIRTAAVAKGATVESYLGTDLIVGGGIAQRKQSGVVAFLSRSLAVAGDIDSVKYAVAHANMTQTPSLNPALAAKINAISASADAWFVSLVPGSTVLPDMLHTGSATSGGGNAQAAALQSIVQSSGSVRFGDQIALSFQAETRSDKDATSLADVVRFVSSLIQMRRDSDPHLSTLATAFDNMQLSTSGNTMSLAISIPEKDFEQLAHQMHAGHGTGSPEFGLYGHKPAEAKPAEKL
jgi:hypothetical protein